MKTTLFLSVSSILLLSLTRLRSAEPDQPLLLENDRIQAKLDGRGLVALLDLEAKRTLTLEGETFSVELDGVKHDGAALLPAGIERSANSVDYKYIVGGAKLTATYELRPGWRFVAKRLLIASAGKPSFRVGAVEVFRAAIEGSFREHLLQGGTYGALLRFDGKPAESFRFGIIAG